MGSGKGTLTVLEKADLEMIHGATMEVLDKTGVFVDSPEALDLLEGAGHRVDRNTRVVRMSESSVSEAVKSCAHNFRWHARSEKRSMDVVDGRTKFGPGAQCLFYIDPDTGEYRPSTLQDGVRITRLVDALDTCAVGYVPVYPGDVPAGAMSMVMWATSLMHTSKPSFGSSGDPVEFELMLRIVELILGDREMLAKKRAIHLLPWAWVTILMLYQGGQFVKSVRYFIPIYPALALLFGTKKGKVETPPQVGNVVKISELQSRFGKRWSAYADALKDEVRAAGKNPVEGLVGIRNVAISVLPLFSMCDRRDVGGIVASSNTGAPTMFLYDRFEGGLGFVDRAAAADAS